MGEYNYDTRFRIDYIKDQLAKDGFDLNKLREQGDDLDAIFEAANTNVENDTGGNIFYNGAEISQIREALWEKIGDNKAYFDIDQSILKMTDPDPNNRA